MIKNIMESGRLCDILKLTIQEAFTFLAVHIKQIKTAIILRITGKNPGGDRYGKNSDR